MTNKNALRARLAALPYPEPPPSIGLRLRARIAAEETVWRRETVREQFADGRQTERRQEMGFREEALPNDNAPSKVIVRQETIPGMITTHTTYL